jgi:hypothetical protein
MPTYDALNYNLYAAASVSRIFGAITVLFIVGYSTTHNSINSASMHRGNSGNTEPAAHEDAAHAAMTEHAAHEDAAHAAVSMLNMKGGVTTWQDFKTAENSWNWHLICFTIVFSIAMTESVLSFKSPFLLACKPQGVYLHIFWQMISVIFTITGMVAITQNKLAGGYEHMFSLHAWTGAVTLFLHLTQIILGLVLYLGLHGSTSYESACWWHSVLGRIVLFAGIETCINGWMDYQMMMQMSGQYSYNSATMLEAAIGVALYLQAGSLLVFFWLIPISVPTKQMENVPDSEMVITKLDDKPRAIPNFTPNTQVMQFQPAVFFTGAPTGQKGFQQVATYY